jgi:hypothetical protein
VQCPSPIGTVRDLRRNVLATVDGRPRTNANETEKETGPRAPTAPFDTGLLGNRLYPLSYEGLRCTFALDAGESPSVGLGISLPTVCAARAACRVRKLLATARTRGEILWLDRSVADHSPSLADRSPRAASCGSA